MEQGIGIIGHLRRFTSIMMLAAVISAIPGCVNANKLDITSLKVNTITPEGFRAVKGMLTAGIDNRSVEFRLFEIEGVVHRNAQELGIFSMDPVTVTARTQAEYTIKGKLSLNDVSVLELLSLIRGSEISEYKADLRFKVKPKGGAVQRMKFKDIPVENIISMLR